jgi:ring-1,2-phenylacetyl-CoA epoxidase subunit PaaC
MATTETPEFDDLGDLSDRQQAALEALLFRLADDELVVAERYTEWQVRAPTLESDISIGNIAQDELGHARLWYELLKQLGYDETELIWERDPADFTHSTLTELPFAEGDWADAVVRSYLYDEAEDVRLHALESSSVRAVRDRVGKVLAEEDYHLEYARAWLERLAGDEASHERLQAALDRLFPYALTLFEPVGEVEEDVDEFGFRTAPLSEMRDEWLSRVETTLEDLDIEVPELDLPEQYDVHVSPDSLPEAVGRDGEHTTDWPDLHEELTATYDELGRDHASTIMHSDE